ncbi:MAG: hypothetical protein DYG94_02485 [Leptolyngbya sp. PLA3]|nr:MAG: hypothetical protein EDM82_02070 [Cyanobacteria bacterium CYA]MCE7967597.1 hypothetical protein [Leptolyngbya sp. PL-A3]
MAGQRVAFKSSPSSVASRIIITSLVSALAGTLGACSTTTNTASQRSFNQTAELSSVQIAPDATVGRYDASFYSGQAREVNAPSEWVTEAVAQSSLLQLQRAKAEGARVEAAANRTASLAQADEMLAEAAALHQIAGFEAQRQRTAQDIRFNQLEEEIRAHRTLSEITQRSGQIEIGSVMSDLKGQVSMMTAEADAAWAAAQIECERLRAEHERVSAQGEAIIGQMNEQVQLVGQRADFKIASLEAQAQATVRRAEAEAQLLAQQARSQSSSGKDRQSELSQQADYVLSRAKAESNRLNAEATRIESSNIEGTYRSSIAQAEQNFAWAKTRGNELRETAMHKLNSYTAQFTSARQEADYQFNSDSAAHQSAIDALAAEDRQVKATFSIALSRAQEFEFDARETFVQKEMGLDTTGRPTSEVRFNAEQKAEALAAAFRAVTSNDPAAVDILSETEHGDEFVKAVAQSDQMRSTAKSTFERDIADVASRRMQAEIAFEDAHAVYNNTKSQIASAETNATTEVEQMFAQADALLQQSERDYEQACINAAATRDQAIAQAKQLRTSASATVASAESKSAQLKSDSEAALATAQALATEFEQKKQALLASAQAESNQFLAQADLVRSDKSRCISDLNDRIAASKRLLDTELARLKAVGQQTYEIARLEHEEAMLIAGTFERIGTARVEALAAQNVLSAQNRTNALSRSESDLNTERQLVHARIDAGLAQTDATLEAFETEDSLRRARAHALEQIMLAYVEHQHATAEAEESTIVARFNSRLAQLQADRDRAYAQAYVDQQQSRTEAVTAGAPVPPALSDATLARLEMAASNIRQAAEEAKRILETSQAESTAQAGGDALEMTQPGTSEVANVPTDGN